MKKEIDRIKKIQKLNKMKEKRKVLCSAKVKVVVLGDERVGKTSLTKRYILNGLLEEQKVKDYIFDNKE
jgi:GTPase SAR1 family protein